MAAALKHSSSEVRAHPRSIWLEQWAEPSHGIIGDPAGKNGAPPINGLIEE